MWFSKSQHPKSQQKPLFTHRVEIEVDKKANRKVKESARQINEDVANLFDENGFTIKIFLAAGGHAPKSRRA